MEENPEIISVEDQLFFEGNYYQSNYSLSSEFFENILNYEANLKEKFDPKIFFELINLYSKAIEYYESLNDDKYKIYNQALIYLFDQPEAKKFMEGRDLAKIFRKKELMNKFKEFEKIVTEDKVKSFIDKKINEENILKSINNLFNNDMNNQKKYLEKKIKEKKLKYKNKRQQREEEKNQNGIENNEKIKINKKEEKLEDGFKSKENEVKNIFSPEEKENDDINKNNTQFNKESDLINVDIDENKENKNNDKNSNDEITYKKIDLKQSLKLTNKTRFSEKISNNFDIYFTSYYNCFINNNIDLIINDFNSKSEEATKKGCGSSVEILNQIKDMEYIMKDNNNEDNYRNEIQKIIEELKVNQNKKIENSLNEISNFSKNINQKYLINDSLFKEKFKLDTTKLLNNYIFK